MFSIIRHSIMDQDHVPDDLINPLQNNQDGIGYYEYLIGSFDFIILVPFRLRKSAKDVITSKKNLLHQVVCGALLACSLLCCLTDFGDAINFNVYKDPVSLFGIAIKGIKIVYVVVFFNMFWRKTERVVEFANVSSSEHPPRRKFFYLFITFYPILLNGLLINQLFQDNNFTFIFSEEQWQETLYQGYRLAGLVVSVILTNFVDIHFFVFTYLGRSIVRRQISELEQLKTWSLTGKKWKHGDFSGLIEMAQKIESFFESLNSMGSSFVLAWFCMVVPWVSYKFVDSLPGTGRVTYSSSSIPFLADFVYYWSYIGMYIVIFVFCAEIKRQCDNLKCTMREIILQHDPTLISGKAAITHIEFALENVGIHGGYFFKYSYSFLGSAAGLVVAYVFLSLQLRLNCCTSSNATN